MEVLIRNAEGNLSNADREYAAQKLGRLDRYFNRASHIEIVHREHKHGKAAVDHIVQVTVFADGMTFRGEEKDASVRAAIDMVGEKLENRLRRVKEKMVNKYRHASADVPVGYTETATEELDANPFAIKSIKRFGIKPQTLEDAILEMELIGKDFFVFKDQDTGQVQVLYRSKEGSLGLVVPEA